MVFPSELVFWYFYTQRRRSLIADIAVRAHDHLLVGSINIQKKIVSFRTTLSVLVAFDD